MKHKLLLFAVASVVWAGGILPAGAQWITQTINLRQGWNAVYLHVDASYDTLNNVVGPGAATSTPITQVWLWQANHSTAQFVTSPQQPTVSDSQWISWQRSSDGPSQLQRLVGNAAYLVYATSAYVWYLKGGPVQPSYQWTSSGLNFVGFPTPAGQPPFFSDFLAPAPALRQNLEIFQYVGGELGVGNPVQVFALRATSVNRGQAFWIRSDDSHNRYFAPFELTLGDTRDLRFADSRSACGFRVRNLTSSQVVVTLSLLSSEAPPSGGPAPALPPLLIRGARNLTNLTYSYVNFTPGMTPSWPLAPAGQVGSEVEIVLGLNRYTAPGNPGGQMAAILRLTDSLGFAQIDLPVSATIASSAGLWVGSASISQVGQYLKSYQMDNQTNPVVGANGQYVVTSLNTNLGSVARAFSLRLIVHNPTNGNAVLLQRVYCGLDAQTNAIVATGESALGSAFLSTARRASATHLPWSAANSGWDFNGQLGRGATVTTTVALSYNDHASNPFVHTYHPDHDNLDSTFTSVLAQGAESYSVRRDIALRVTPPADDFASLTSSSQTLSGDYQETLTILGLPRSGGTSDSRQFQVTGGFSLNRISANPTLTKP